MATTNDIGSQVDALLGTQSCSPLVGVRMSQCPTCNGGGIVGDERKHATCEECAGTGELPALEGVEHWHEGPLGADQFCAACDAEAA